MDSELYSHCNGGAADEGGEELADDFPVRVKEVKIAPCISLDQFVIGSDKLGDFLFCLVSNAASFMNSLFDMAKGAIEGLINTIKGWIESSSASNHARARMPSFPFPAVPHACFSVICRSWMGHTKDSGHLE